MAKERNTVNALRMVDVAHGLAGRFTVGVRMTSALLVGLAFIAGACGSSAGDDGADGSQSAAADEPSEETEQDETEAEPGDEEPVEQEPAEEDETGQASSDDGEGWVRPGPDARYPLTATEVLDGLRPLSQVLDTEPIDGTLAEIIGSVPGICPPDDLAVAAIDLREMAPPGTTIIRQLSIFSSDEDAAAFVETLAGMEVGCTATIDEDAALIVNEVTAVEPLAIGALEGVLVTVLSKVDVKAEGAADPTITREYNVVQDGNAVLVIPVLDSIEDIVGQPVIEPLVLATFEDLSGLAG